MKRTVLTALFATLALASPAHALKITNLDSVPHTVVYRTSGEDFEQVVEPSRSVHFHGMPDGLLSLKPAAGQPRKASSPGKLHMDGILSGIVGAPERNEDIPAASNYDFVIWPGGRLVVQSRRQGDIF